MAGFAVRDLAFGIHAVRVTREGFTPQESRVRVTRSRASHSMVVALERPRATAAASRYGAAGGACSWTEEGTDATTN